MTSKQHAETTDVDKVILNFEKEKDFCVEPATLQSLQPLIQWVANFTLYLLASLPQHYHSMTRYPGASIVKSICCCFFSALLYDLGVNFSNCYNW